MEPLTNEQVEFAISMVVKWMHVCEDNNRGSSAVDADHSSLLRRLLMGKPLLEHPPPRRYSYPCWDMVEKPEVQIQELWEDDNCHIVYYDGKKIAIEPPVVIIDQCAEYCWEDKEQKIIKHVPSGLRWQYFKKTAYPIAVAVGMVEDHPYQGKFLRRLF